MQKVVLDTNILLSSPEVISRNDIEIILPYVVLAELDKLKRNPDLVFPAKHAIKLIKDAYIKKKIKIINIPTDISTNDEMIVQSAKENDASLWSDDVGASVVALSQDVPLFGEDVVDYDDSYIGYSYHTVDSDFYYKTLNMINELQIPEVEEMTDIRAGINEYIIIRPSDGSLNELIFRRTENSYILVPNSKKLFRGLSPDGKKAIDFEFLHPEQACAFDAVFNTDTPLAVVHGRIGSGKSLLSTIAALARTKGQKQNKVYDRILVTRPNRPISKAYELGFTPGDIEDKMKQWLVGFTSNLEFLYERNLEDIENRTASEIFNQWFVPISIESIQGASFHNSILIVDEGQLLDADALKQIMSRISKGSKLVLIMDTRQAYGANRGHEGWKKLWPHLKHNRLVSFIDLQTIQRSELVGFVDEIF